MSKVNRTAIQWADYSVNPIRARNRETGKVGWHCERVSDGCKNCYSATLNRVYGSGTNYAADQTPKVEFFLDEACLKSMLTFKPKGPFKNERSRAAVFPFDMTDVFGSWVPDEWLDRIFAVFALRPDVDWLVLTKRSKRMRHYVQRLYSRRFQIVRDLMPFVPLKSPAYDMVSLDELGKQGDGWPLPNVWLGVSVENQERADERIPDLLATPAAVRFVSAEPLLSGIDFEKVRHGSGYGSSPCEGCGLDVYIDALAGSSYCGNTCDGPVWPGLDWIIPGGESGPKARPCSVEWIRSIQAQCAAAGVPVFVKQLGSKPMVRTQDPPGIDWIRLRHPEFPHRIDSKGGDPALWPSDLRVREMPKEAGR